MGLERFIPDTETVAKKDKTVLRKRKRATNNANGRLGIRRKGVRKRDNKKPLK